MDIMRGTGEPARVEKEYMYLCDPEKHTDCSKRICAYIEAGPLGRCYQTSKLEYARTNLAGEPIITYAHQKSTVEYPCTLPPAKKPFHERFWWLPAAISLVGIVSSVLAIAVMLRL